MTSSFIKLEAEFYKKLKWLMFFRLLFTSLLLGSAIILQLAETSSPLDQPLFVIYELIAGIFLLSFIYSVILRYIKYVHEFAHIQIFIDTFIVTLIIFLTGRFSSLFSLLYLVVIIYSSLLLSRKASLIIACLSSVQYSILIGLNYLGILGPFGIEGRLLVSDNNLSHELYNTTINIVFFFIVAFLSGLLSEQNKKTKKELWAMEDHVKRVEKVASVGEMAAGLAHEIKNPIASISGSIQLLREDLHCNSNHDKLMQIILREADRLSMLVTSFLFFAKPSKGKVEPIEVDKVLSETLELFEKDRMCFQKILISKEFSPGIWIEMDPVHLHQIFWNLLLNAAEAINDNGRIDIKLYRLNKSYACIEIADNGCGMSLEIINSIFDPFFTTKQNGTGLGLSIVQRILESYCSRLDFESNLKKGTTFWIKLEMLDQRNGLLDKVRNTESSVVSLESA
ncbi:MAG TPA: GHKL domain-containing protein [Desulfobacteraceae bacterium]|nr:GHKL domain-containing protein [Desulfobacteraceae bacterium]